MVKICSGEFAAPQVELVSFGPPLVSPTSVPPLIALVMSVVGSEQPPGLAGVFGWRGSAGCVGAAPGAASGADSKPPKTKKAEIRLPWILIGVVSEAECDAVTA